MEMQKVALLVSKESFSNFFFHLLRFFLKNAAWTKNRISRKRQNLKKKKKKRKRTRVTKKRLKLNQVSREERERESARETERKVTAR